MKPDWRFGARFAARLYRWAGLVFVAVVALGIPNGLDWGAIFLPAGFFLLAWSLGVAGREQPALVAVVAPAARESVEIAAPESGPDQCRVCGVEDLATWPQADDRILEESAPTVHVVAYGAGRAHRTCAELQPYVNPAEERDQKVAELESVTRIAKARRLGTAALMCEWVLERLAFEAGSDEEYSSTVETDPINPSDLAMVAAVTGGGIRAVEVRARFEDEE